MLQESKMIIEAYRREKQKAEVGAQDPAETSWKLIKEKVQTRFTAEIVFRVFDWDFSFSFEPWRDSVRDYNQAKFSQLSKKLV